MAPKRAAAASAASSSSLDGGALQEKLVRLFEELDGSATKEAIEERMSGTAPKGALMAALNSLLAIKRVAISKTAAGGLVFRLQSDQSAKRARTLDGLTAEDRLLYQEIERAGNAGIKSKDLRVRSNVQQQQVAKVLRTLESRGLIRSVKSVAAKNQKLYMLAGLEPSVAVTGGAWYTDDQEFDHALIQASLEYIARSATLTATAQQVRDVATLPHHQNFGEEAALAARRDEPGPVILFRSTAASRREPTGELGAAALDCAAREARAAADDRP